MLHLIQNNIHVNQFAEDKSAAIKKIAGALVHAGFVDEGYGEGMLERETQAATYLGIGIAIPHGTTTTRHLVKKTGVQVFCFPEGVAWGDDDEKAYMAIGIAASSNEHLDLLRQLTQVLSADDVEEQIKNIKTINDVIAILTGDTGSGNHDFVIDKSVLRLDIAADSLPMLQALNASCLKQQSAVSNEFITNALDSEPSYLSDGVWINDAKQGNLKNAIAISRPSTTLTHDGKPVKLLISMSAVDDGVSQIIDTLAHLSFNQQLNQLTSANSDELIAILQSSAEKA